MYSSNYSFLARVAFVASANSLEGLVGLDLRKQRYPASEMGRLVLPFQTAFEKAEFPFPKKVYRNLKFDMSSVPGLEYRNAARDFLSIAIGKLPLLLPSRAKTSTKRSVLLYIERYFPGTYSIAVGRFCELLETAFIMGYAPGLRIRITPEELGKVRGLDAGNVSNHNHFPPSKGRKKSNSSGGSV
jgi:hypothetical protein